MLIVVGMLQPHIDIFCMKVDTGKKDLIACLFSFKRFSSGALPLISGHVSENIFYKNLPQNHVY
jgi:hypothetical protein